MRDYHLSREKASRRIKNAKRQRRIQLKEQVEPSNGKKRKRESEDDGRETIKRRRIEESKVPPSVIQKQTEPRVLEDSGSVPPKEQVCRDILQIPIPPPPALLDSLEIGLNEVTRALERSITTLRSSQNKNQLPSEFKPISLILVCLADINPPNLVAHIPHLVSVYNSMLMTQGIVAAKKRRKGLPLSSDPPRPEGIKLVTLPKNAESSLAGSIGLRRISVVAFYVCSFCFALTPHFHRSLPKDSAPLGIHLTTLLSQTPVLAVPWQIPQAIPTKVAMILERTHIKHIATTAPLDMNLARKERRQGRENAKARRKITKLEERKKRIAKVQEMVPDTAQVFEKPRTVGRQTMTLRSATAAATPPAPTIKATSQPTAPTTKSGKPPAASKMPLRTSPRLRLNNSNQKDKKVKKV